MTRINKQAIAVVFLSSFLFFLHPVFAQPEVDFTALAQKYPDEDVVILEKKLNIRIAIVNGVPEVYNDYKQILVLLTEKANYYNTQSVGFSEQFEELMDVEAISYVPEKGKLKKIVSASPEISYEGSDNIFFDDYKKATVTFKSLEKGSITVFNYTIKCNDPHLLHPFTMGAYAPVEKATLNVEFPDEVSINPRLYGNKEIPLQFTTQKKKNKNSWTWYAENLEKREDEPGAPEFDKNTIKIFPLMKEYFNGKTNQKVLSDINDLFAWYAKHVKDLNETLTPELKQLSDSLTEGKTELEKIKSVYYWIQDNIRYVAIEDGWGGFIPRKADDIYHKRYGDCKDMANLTTTLLNMAGIKACLTWIGTRDIPYTYSEVPSADSDNHMISAVKVNDKWVFLDATSAFIDFGLPSSFIQGKEALIKISNDSFVLQKVEPVNKSINTYTDTTEISLNQNLLIGKGTCSFAGYWKWDFSNRYLDKHAHARDTDMKKYFSTGNNKCKVDTVIFNGDLKSRDKPLNFTYNFSIPDYIRTIGKEKFVNMNLSKVLENSVVDTAKRKNPVEFRYTTTETNVVKLVIPDNMKATYIPPDRIFESDMAGFKLSYTTNNNYVILTKTIFFNTLQLEKNQFNEWNKMCAELNKAYKELVILTEK